MKENYSRFVVVAGAADKEETYVLDGTTPLADVFTFINERRLLGGSVTRIRVQVDEAVQKPWLERYLPDKEQETAG
jgi:hypothetical protein